MKKILIFGAYGMAGHMVSQYLKTKDDYQITDICHNRRLDNNSILMDIRDIELVKELIIKQSPLIIINCIGILPNKADQKPKDAIFINSYFPRFLEDFADYRDIKIIHLSTDCVFSGRNGQYREDSLRDGQGVYARTKSLGEIKNNRDLTIRTSIIGPELKDDGLGLFDWFMKQDSQIGGYNRVIWTGVTTLQLAQSIAQLIKDDVTGLYHLVPEDSITKYELLNIINKVFNKGINIKKKADPVSDKSLINTRTDYEANIPDYENMIRELREFMVCRRNYYDKYLN